jgi:hypothetical protein
VDLPFLLPMFDDRPSFLGLPYEAIVLAVAIVGLLVGAAWVRRISRADPEPRAFRASTPWRPPFATSLAGAIAISGGVLLAMLAVAWLLRPR